MTSGTDGLTVARRPSAQYLRECFDCRDGVLYWKERPESHFQSRAVWLMFLKKHAGKPAGKLGSGGYMTVGLRVNGRAISMAAHRVVWVLHYGRWPKQYLDHINRVRSDNRIENLREVTPAENLQNCSRNRVYPYVGPYKWGGYQAQVKVGDTSIHIGIFDTEEDARNHRLMVCAEMEKVARALAKKTPHPKTHRKRARRDTTSLQHCG
jgi:hypothetical protein